MSRKQRSTREEWSTFYSILVPALLQIYGIYIDARAERREFQQRKTRSWSRTVTKLRNNKYIIIMEVTCFIPITTVSIAVEHCTRNGGICCALCSTKSTSPKSRWSHNYQRIPLTLHHRSLGYNVLLNVVGGAQNGKTLNKCSFHLNYNDGIRISQYRGVQTESTNATQSRICSNS